MNTTRSKRPILALICLCLGSLPVVAENAPTHHALSQFLQRHCVECHGPAKAKGDLRLDQLSPDPADDAARKQWNQILDRIASGEMPPDSKPRPPEAETKAATDQMRATLHAAEQARRAKEGRIVLRRLNRVEYENTIRDLLGVEGEFAQMLPPDSSADGFDNVGDALHTSSFLMERYLDAAYAALDLAITNKAKAPAPAVKRYKLTDAHQVKATTERVFRKADDGGVTMFTSSAWQRVTLYGFYPPERGRFRFKVAVSAVQSGGKPVTFDIRGGGGGVGRGESPLVGYFDAPVAGGAGEVRVIEFEKVMPPKTTISILPYGLAGSKQVHTVGADAWDGPGLAVHWVEVEGPINESWPPPSHRWLFGDLPQKAAPAKDARDRVEVTSAEPEADAKRVLTAFARRAFRRPVTDADVAPYLGLVKARLADKYSFERAVRVGLAGILVSPEFLFLHEKPGKLADFAIASRLSYFLWSSTPDAALLAAAERGGLREAGELARQVDRMLADPRAANFSRNFVGQWLNLRDIDATMPGHILYPEYDGMLKESMVREAELFFAELLKNDESTANFIASDFSMLNGRLARHYGIPGVDGWEFRRVKLPPESHRGGVLTMAATLKVTANGTATSPVLRGAWVLDKVLGTPPSPPPPNVGTIEPDTRGTSTIREQLAKHRQLESCASCHVKMDPPGFALESFDVIGGYREFYRATGNGKPVVIDGKRMPYLHGKPVDPSDVLPDGRKFANVDELKQHLLADQDKFARGLTVKLATYATGGAPERVDGEKVDAIVKRVASKGYGLRTLVKEIVGSELFLTK
ncbi:MAG TPA: DUF1592 domain-containing protein [Tepidisphaeraceae bacterium]|nr:DUF1592 domain-containing protein [Tepidisphaeraceae bacterium]